MIHFSAISKTITFASDALLGWAIVLPLVTGTCAWNGLWMTESHSSLYTRSLLLASS